MSRTDEVQGLNKELTTLCAQISQLKAQLAIAIQALKDIGVSTVDIEDLWACNLAREALAKMGEVK